MTVTPELEQSVREAVASRATAFGHSPTPEEVRLEWLPEGTVPGIEVFRARYRAGESRGAITGIVADGEPPNTYPNDALVTVWQRWIAEHGHLPDGPTTAEVSAFLLGGAGPHEIVVDDTHPAPSVVEGPEPGVVFWWRQRNGLAETTLRLDSGMIDISHGG